MPTPDTPQERNEKAEALEVERLLKAEEVERLLDERFARLERRLLLTIGFLYALTLLAIAVLG
jgi:hypothetical protein